MKSKNVTIDELAVMVQKGFGGVDKHFEVLEYRMDKRFDKIENLVLASHQKRIEKLENEVKELKELFAFK